MAITSIRCPVLGTHVTRVTDFEGTVTRVICPEYDGSNAVCRLKQSAYEGGPLAQLLQRMSENTIDTRSTLCTLRAA